MTQIFLHQSEQGIVLATDGRAVSRPSEEKRECFEVQKIFPLSPHVVLVTGGAGYGVLLCQRFQSHVRSSRLSRYDDIADIALPYLRQETEKVLREMRHPGGLPELERVYFLIAGNRPESPDNPFASELLGSESAGDPLHTITTGPIVAIPRHMGIEYRLSRFTPSHDELSEIESLCENFLLKIARENADVGPPFYFVRITAADINIRTRRSQSEEISHDD